MLESENLPVVWPRGNKPLSSDLGFLTQSSLETPLCGLGRGWGGGRGECVLHHIWSSSSSVLIANGSYYLYDFIFQKRIEGGTSQLSTFFLVRSRHPGIYFTKNLYASRLPCRINTITVYSKMRKVGHVSDDFPKGILLPKAELPGNPGPSD